jgi:hypothetical protein
VLPAGPPPITTTSDCSSPAALNAAAPIERIAGILSA